MSDGLTTYSSSHSNVTKEEVISPSVEDETAHSFFYKLELDSRAGAGNSDAAADAPVLPGGEYKLYKRRWLGLFALVRPLCAVFVACHRAS
jgi:hypothetical protein